MNPKAWLESWRQLPPEVQDELRQAARAQPGDQEAILEGLVRRYLLTHTPAGMVKNVVDSVDTSQLPAAAKLAGKVTSSAVRGAKSVASDVASLASDVASLASDVDVKDAAKRAGRLTGRWLRKWRGQ